MELLRLQPIQADLIHLCLQLIYLLTATPLGSWLLPQILQLERRVVNIDQQSDDNSQVELGLCLELAILSEKRVQAMLIASNVIVRQLLFSPILLDVTEELQLFSVLFHHLCLVLLQDYLQILQKRFLVAANLSQGDLNVLEQEKEPLQRNLLKRIDYLRLQFFTFGILFHQVGYFDVAVQDCQESHLQPKEQPLEQPHLLASQQLFEFHQLQGEVLTLLARVFFLLELLYFHRGATDLDEAFPQHIKLLLSFVSSSCSRLLLFQPVDADLLVLEDLFPGDTILLVFHEHSGNKLPEFKRSHFSFLVFLPKNQLFALHRVEILLQSFQLLGFVVECVQAIVSQLIQHAPKRKNIYFRAALLLLNDLRSDVERGTLQRQIFNALGILHVFNDSEICDFVNSLLDQYVFWFNVAMDDVGIVEDLVAFAELLKEIPNFSFGHQLRTIQNGLE